MNDQRKIWRSSHRQRYAVHAAAIDAVEAAVRGDEVPAWIRRTCDLVSAAFAMKQDPIRMDQHTL